MLWLNKFKKWLSKKPKPPDLAAAVLSNAVAKDLGVKVTRIPLPSGGEVVIVEQVYDDVEESNPAEEYTP